jgi:integrase
MRGFVRKRGSTYTWYFDVPDPLTGKRKQHSRGGFRTKRAAQEALNEALARLREGTFVQPSPRRLGSFLVEEWLPAVRPPRVRPSTWATYRMAVERHIFPAIGGVVLQRLTPAHLTTFYRALLDNGRRKGRGGLAPKTVRNVHGVLHAALRDAVRWGYLPRNVAAGADLPKRMTPEMHVWNPEQLRTFLEQVWDDALYAAWMLFATTGMRRGEVAGLRWSDVDLEAGRVSPRRPRVVVDYEVHVSEPKTAKGRRSLALDPATVAALREHRTRQLEQRLAVGHVGRTWAWCSPGRTAARSIRNASPGGSSSTRGPLACRGSGCMTFATATRPRRWPPASRPRWSVSGSATPTSPSPWTPTATCCLAWTPRRPARWPASSLALPSQARTPPLTNR